MTKRKRGSSRVEIPLNNHVTLRVQHDYPLDEKDIIKLNEVYNRSLLCIDVALAEVRKVLKKLLSARRKLHIPEEFIHHHQYMIDLLKGHFNLDTAISVRRLSLRLREIRDKLQAMREGLYAENNSITLSHISKRQAQPHQGFFDSDLGGYVRQDKDRIYLNLDHLNFSSDYMCRVLIHECSHKFSGSKDFDKLYYSNLNYSDINEGLVHLMYWVAGSYEKLQKLTPEKRMNHADSIANFVIDVARHSPLTQVDAKMMQPYPDRELIKTDVGRLFTAKKPINKFAAVTNVLQAVLAAEIGYVAYKILL